MCGAQGCVSTPYVDAHQKPPPALRSPRAGRLSPQPTCSTSLTASPRPGPRPQQPSCSGRTPREHGEKAFCNVSPFQVVGKETSQRLLRLLLYAVTLKNLNDLQNGSCPPHGRGRTPDGQLRPEKHRPETPGGRPEVLGPLPIAPPFS